MRPSAPSWLAGWTLSRITWSFVLSIEKTVRLRLPPFAATRTFPSGLRTMTWMDVPPVGMGDAEMGARVVALPLPEIL